MTDNVDMTHETLKAYIDGDLGVIADTQRKGNSRLQLLLDLVDQSLSVSKLPTSSDVSDTQFTFEQTEDLLSDLLAGTDSITIKQNFLAALYYSPDFYQRMMIKLDELVPVMEETLDAELLEVAVREDEQVLEELGIGNSGASSLQTKAKNKVRSAVDSVPEKLFGWLGPVPKYVYVVIGLAVIFVSSYFGVRFYNTTYQIMLAEDLIKENYRVYMADTPRLSGGYGSTGIIQLMGEAEDKNFLDRALIYINRALDNQSTSSRLMEIRAQIFIINEDLNRAEQILDQLDAGSKETATVLNDQGVLKYLKGDYDSAANLFKRAIEVDDSLVEGFYNLAMVQVKMGDKSNAMQTMMQLLSIEQDEGWRGAAETFIESIK
jgi:tetratricopeptide (TPR) repeat protein